MKALMKIIKEEKKFWGLEHRCARSQYSKEHCMGVLHGLNIIELKVKITPLTGGKR